MRKLVPVSNKILVKRDAPESVTAGGIHIPENSKDKPTTGVVVACGPGFVSEDTGHVTPCSVKVGDRIMFSVYAGNEVRVGEDTLSLMSDREVQAIVVEE